MTATLRLRSARHGRPRFGEAGPGVAPGVSWWAVAGDQKAGSRQGLTRTQDVSHTHLMRCHPLDGSEGQTGPDSHLGRSSRVPSGCRPMNGCPGCLRGLYPGSRRQKRMSVSQETRRR